MSQVAIITGGTSGIGLDVARKLGESGAWHVHIIGSSSQRGREAASSVPNTTYNQADVRNYPELAKTFARVFAESGRIDFVFVNAGVAESHDFFAPHTEADLPPEPPIGLIRINLDGAMNTAYLAMHYFRRSPILAPGMKNLIFTASIGGLYPCALTPVYSATKHGIVGFARSIADKLWGEGVRVNTICPGVVKTPLFTDDFEGVFPKEVEIPIHIVTNLILSLLTGDEMVDAKGCAVPSNALFSKTLHISGEKFYFIDQPEFHDEQGRLTWKAMMDRWDKT